jgi:fructosamine-3-kinase
LRACAGRPVAADNQRLTRTGERPILKVNLENKLTVAIWNSIAQTTSAATGSAYVIRHLGLPRCGVVSQAYVVADGDRPYFVKTQGRDRGHARAFAWEPVRCGWGGVEALDNTPADSWAEFWCERRLRPRLSYRAAGTAWDHLRSRIEALLPMIRIGLATHHPTPTLLHSDLHGANWLGQPDGSVALIDAAMWYGDPDVDLAGLSVGTPAACEALACYLKECPRSPGFEWRVAVYRLWYLLQCHPGQAGPLLTEALDRIGQGPGK